MNATITASDEQMPNLAKTFSSAMPSEIKPTAEVTDVNALGKSTVGIEIRRLLPEAPGHFLAKYGFVNLRFVDAQSLRSLSTWTNNK